jgi:hypothetical protein
LVKFGDGRR